MLCALMVVLGMNPDPARAQPALSVSTVDQARVGQPFQLEVEVRWTGPAGRYVLYPPKVTLPITVRMGAQRQSFGSQGADTVYHYGYTLVPDAEGDQQIGPVTLEYRDMEAATDAKAEPVRDEGPTVHVQPGGTRGWLGRLLLPALVIGALGAAVVWRRRKLQAEAAAPPAPPEPPPQSLLDDARRYLLEGRADEVYATLLKLKPRLPAGEDPLPSVEQLEAERLRARYGGGATTREELERLVRAVERVLRTA